MEPIGIRKLKERFADKILEVNELLGEWTAVVQTNKIVECCTFLRDEPETQFNFLSDLCGVESLLKFRAEKQQPRFAVVYHLYSIPFNYQLRLKVWVSEGERVPSVTSVWSAANWLEREVYDMFGIIFDKHPDLRRILMSDDWIGHPLRKDFPLTYEAPQFTYNKNQVPRIINKF